LAVFERFCFFIFLFVQFCLNFLSSARLQGQDIGCSLMLVF